MSNGRKQLVNVFSRSWPGTSVIEVSLVKDTDPELPYYKDRFFVFLSCMPGVNNADGSRGYDKDNRISMKIGIDKLRGFAKALAANARGANSLKHALFTQSNNVTKIAWASTYLPQGKDQSERAVSISFKAGQNKPIGSSMSPFDAMAIADEIEFICQKGLEAEFIDRLNNGRKAAASNTNTNNTPGPFDTKPNLKNRAPAPPVPDGDVNVGSSPFEMDDVPF